MNIYIIHYRYGPWYYPFSGTAIVRAANEYIAQQLLASQLELPLRAITITDVQLCEPGEGVLYVHSHF